MKTVIKDIDIITACETSKSMAEACSKVNLHWNTFRKKAIELGVFNPNPYGKGLKKPKRKGYDSYDLDDILKGKHPQYQSNKLRIRLLTEGVKEHQCECCLNSTWNGKKISLEVNHIDGNRHNHLLNNLELLCPNCHAQTETYKGKNVKK